ncbi:hypothetical protein AAVH_24475 [Aphelenchoides avenae]|nr:hypothetical protein AAVH_24475 [Aphelenchus avenae]
MELGASKLSTAYIKSLPRLPVASECSQQPTTEDAKEVAKASIELQVEDIFNFIEKAGSTKTSESVSAGGIQWQLRVESPKADDCEIPRCFLQGADENGVWSRWVTADFFVFDQRDWRKVGGVSETMVGSAPLPASAGELRLFSDEASRMLCSGLT